MDDKSIEFTKKYLIEKLMQYMDRKEAIEVFSMACNEAGLKDRSDEYGIDEFIKLSEAIKHQGGMARFVGSLAIVAAKCSNVVKRG